MKPSAIYVQSLSSSGLPVMTDIVDALQSRYAAKYIFKLDKLKGANIEKQLHYAIGALNLVSNTSKSVKGSDLSTDGKKTGNKEFQSISIINSVLNFPPPFTNEADLLLTTIFSKNIRSVSLRNSVSTAAQAGLILASVMECDSLAYLDIGGFAPPCNTDESDALKEGIQSAFGVSRLMRLGIESTYPNNIASVIFSMLPGSSIRVLGIGNIFDEDKAKNDIDLAFEIAEALRLSTSIRGMSFSFNNKNKISEDVLEVLREAMKTTVSLVSLTIGNNRDEELKKEIEEQMGINMYIATGRSSIENIEHKARTKILNAINQLADGMDFICSGASVIIDGKIKERTMSELRGIFKRLQLSTLMEPDCGGDARTLKMLVEERVKPVRVHSNTLKILNDVLKESLLKNAEKSCVMFPHNVLDSITPIKSQIKNKEDISIKDLVPENVAAEPKESKGKKGKKQKKKSSNNKSESNSRTENPSSHNNSSYSIDVSKQSECCDCSLKCKKLEKIIESQANKITDLVNENKKMLRMIENMSAELREIHLSAALKQLVEDTARKIVDESLSNLDDLTPKVTQEVLDNRCTAIESSITTVKKSAENAIRKLRLFDTKFGVAENDIRDLNDKLERISVSRTELDSMRDGIQARIDKLQENIDSIKAESMLKTNNNREMEELQENINIMMAELDEKIQHNSLRIDEVGKRFEDFYSKNKLTSIEADKRRFENIESAVSGVTVRIQSSVDSLVSLIAASQGELETKFDSQIKTIEDRIGSLESATILGASLLRGQSNTYEVN